MMADDVRLNKNQRIKESRNATKERRKSQRAVARELKIDVSHCNKKILNHLFMLFIEAKRFYNYAVNMLNNGIIIDYKTDGIFIKTKTGRFIKKHIKYLTSSMKDRIIQDMLVSCKSIKNRKYNNPSSKSGRLKFKSERNYIMLKQFGVTHDIDIVHNKIRIQGIKSWLKVFGLSQLNEIEGTYEISTAQLIKKPDGYYFKIVLWLNDKPDPTINRPVGIDMGIKSSVTTSDGVFYNCQIQETERLKSLQRKLSRQKKGSKGFNKTRQLLRIEYQHMDNLKQNSVNHILHDLCQYESIYMQDENIAAWHKSKAFSSKVQHSYLGRLKIKLMNQSLRNLFILPKSVPTSKLCPKCFNRHDSLKLNDRVFICPHCNHNDGDRDIHAARNMILIYKLYEFIENHIEDISKELNISIDEVYKIPVSELGKKFFKQSTYGA